MKTLIDEVTFLQPENFSYKTEFDKCPDWLENLYAENRIRPYSNGVVSFIVLASLHPNELEVEQFRRLRFNMASDRSHRGNAQRTPNCILPGDKIQLWDDGSITLKKHVDEQPVFSGII